MKTDRELLELAAKAAGLKVFWGWPSSTYQKHDRLYRSIPDLIMYDAPEWNPLTDDGDALRLAVKLRLECMYEATELGPCHCQFWIAGEGFKQVTEQLNDDPYAATRRAITRAAAAIGEGMK